MQGQRMQNGQMNMSSRRCIFILLFFCMTAALAMEKANVVAGTTPVDLPTVTFQLDPTADGITINWHIDQIGKSRASATLNVVLSRLSHQRYGDYLLPMHLEPLLLPEDAAATLLWEQVESVVWTEPLPTPEPLSPALIGWAEAEFPRQHMEHPLPNAPVFVLREGHLRGQRIAVLAFSPIFQEQGELRLAHRLKVHLPQGQAIADPVSVADRLEQPAGGQTIPTPSPTIDPLSINPAALQSAVKVRVADAGMQEVHGVRLLQLGVAGGSSLEKLQARCLGQRLPLEVRDDDGKLDMKTVLRFYVAPTSHTTGVGDRWNKTLTCWLYWGDKAGLRMAERSVLPDANAGDVPVRDSGFAEGIWEANYIYESTMAGVDGDHWFAAKLRVEPAQQEIPARYPAQHINFQQQLPLAHQVAESAVFTVTGAARTRSIHELTIGLADEQHPFTWSPIDYYEPWQHVVTAQPSAQMTVTMVANGYIGEIRLDKVYWRQPVLLDFGDNGATFYGVHGEWRYQLMNTPVERTLYDVTNPEQSTILHLPTGRNVQFQDGPTARHYLLAGGQTIQEPTLTMHNPLAITNVMGGEALYIAPADMLEPLAPLILHRQNQGYQALAVDVQEIYDGWGEGQISPTAIRNFLRYAAVHWQPAPLAVVLVGDSTTDPHNYTGHQQDYQNVNQLPAYFADVDPWIGETACENCFAQLDGDDPVHNGVDPDFLPDLWLGRFSVQNREQLTALVDKLLHYESARGTGADQQWRQTMLYVADKYISASGVKDKAGNFAAFFDRLVDGDPTANLAPLQPADLMSQRLYYDPRPGGVSDPWREPDAVQARLRTLALIKAGAGIVAYSGHGNYFQWASTNPRLPEPYLLGINDVYALGNGTRLPILLEMTCYTAQFTNVSASGTTLDERFLRQPDGGAIAVWGSAGLTVNDGHTQLIEGFQRALWQEPTYTAPLGALVEAGYLALFTSGTCCQETRYLYLLLGDPLTPVRLGNLPDWQTTYLPVVHR